jgi:hypothetical protein
MLREKGLKKFAEVVTADGHPLGSAMRFFHRAEAEVNPELRLYGTYLEIQSIELGGPSFVPTDFIADYDARANRVTLAADFKMVVDELWNRMPDFVARGTGAVEELPG